LWVCTSGFAREQEAGTGTVFVTLWSSSSTGGKANRRD
jgi:hypothetical protein